MTRHVGRAESHESARAHVTGQAKYVDDLVPTLASVAHAWPVVAPHARARVLAIDFADALAQPGVLHVLTATDVPGENDIGAVRHDEPLFPSEVSFHGQAVAWVLAESLEAARLAAARVQVAYEPLPALLGIAQAIAAESFLTEPECMRRGDPHAELAAAPEQLSGELFLHGQEHFYLETQSALALIDESGGVLVHASTQHPSETQEIVARVLGIAKHQVVVQCLRMGGGFGGKEVQASGWAAIAALGARLLQRPVRVRLNRAQDTTMTGKRHPFFARFQVGFERTGQLRALVVELFSDGGYSLDLSAPIMGRALFHIDNCYLLPNLEATGRACRTNTVSHTAFRGFGGPQGMVVIEEILDRIARTLGIAPDLVRERNFYRPGDHTHYGQEVKDAERITRIFAELKRSSAYDTRRDAVDLFNRTHVHKKRGLAITPVKFGISFTTTFFNQAGALVLIYRDGSVQVNHGGTEMGQGLHTKIAQIAAEALGVALTSIRVMPTRTDKIPNSSATAASSGSDLNGAAVKQACDVLRTRLANVAARRFAVAEGAIVFDDGRVYPRANPTLAKPFATVVQQAYLERVPLFESGFYSTPEIHYDAKQSRGRPFHYFAYGAAVSEVEVDAFTGQYELLRTDILHDVGESLSPLIDRGQIEGGFVQGVGWLTTEELLFAVDGSLATKGASTYKLPTLHECPAVLNVSLLREARESGVVYGSKAVGEPPLMLAISVREALRAAVAAFGEGTVELGCPATPEAVYWAIERMRRPTPARIAAQ